MSAITAEVVGDREVAAKLRKFGPELKKQLIETMRRLGIQLQAKVKQDKLSGDPLKNRTGALRRSVAEAQVLGGATRDSSGRFASGDITERVGIFAGPTLRYGRAHEFGFHDTVTVHAHLRMMTKAWGRPVAEPHKIEVRSHSRRMNIPERSFLRSALREFAPTFQAGIREVVGEAVAEANR